MNESKYFDHGRLKGSVYTAYNAINNCECDEISPNFIWMFDVIMREGMN